VTRIGEQPARLLSGKRIVVTRARAQAADLGQPLEALGAAVIYCPTIRIAPATDPLPLQRALQTLQAFDWLVLTSANGVEAVLAELQRQGQARAALAGVRLVCVGPATAAALRRNQLEPAVMPEEFVSREIASALADQLQPGARVLLARAAGADPELPRRLRDLGARVTDIEAYHAVPDLASVEEVRSSLIAQEVDLITFTSPSTATYFVAAVGDLARSVALAAIGPVTAARIRELGFRVSIVAAEHTASGLVAAISDYFAGLRNESE
jgi:uroporphyrinogen III methyltransferase / synthase